MRIRSIVAASCVVLALAGCRDEQAGPKRRPPPLAPSSEPKLLDAAPSDLTFQSGATWAGKAVVYLGSKVTPPARPGQPYTLAHYFRADAPPPAGYQFFAHVVDPDSGQMLGNVDHEIQGGAMPLGRWPVGKIIEDVHQIALPPGLAKAQLRIGFWAGDSRLPVDDPKMQDGQNRVIGPTITAGGPPLPEYEIHRAKSRPLIDGSLDDAAWKDAPEATLVNSFDGSPSSLATRARLLYDDKFLYVAFDCADPDVWGTLYQRDEPIYTQEAVEIFVDADGDGRTYDEIEVSPNNTLFDAYFPARRQGMDLSYDSGAVSAVKVRGTVNDASDRDEGWSVEMRIPLDHLSAVPRVPPRPGDKWRFNLYRLEMHQRQQQEGMAFSPLFQGDFHNLPRFGWLVFR